MAMNSFNAIDNVAETWKTSESQSLNMEQTDMTAVSTRTYDSGSSVEIALKNVGHISLNDFDKWDVIVRYQDGTSQWLPYSVSIPGWSVSSILMDGNPEIFDPGILNPGETLNLVIHLQTPVAKGTTNLATVSTPNGINSEISFGY